MDIVSLFFKGGLVMPIILLLSIYMLAVILYKIFQFYASSALQQHFIEPVMTRVKKGEYTAAEEMLKPVKGPVAHIMRVSIACVLNRHMSSKSRESEITRIGSAEIVKLESHMRGLEMTATTAPLLGLLGTVMGMVTAFSKLASAGSRVDPSTLADGIWEALVATAAGLLVAIPAVAAYYIIDGFIEKVRSRMRDVTIQILALEDEFIRNEKEQEKRDLIERENKIRELQDAQSKAIEQMRSTPQTSSTLRLLSPSYR